MTLSDGSDVYDLKEAVKAVSPNRLRGIDAIDLKVWNVGADTATDERLVFNLLLDYGNTSIRVFVAFKKILMFLLLCYPLLVRPTEGVT